jgi:hypothetical protein
MEIEAFAKLQVGDVIEFRSLTRHNSRKAKRRILSFPLNYDYDNLVDGEFPRSTDFVLVRFEGTPNFYVRRQEVIRVVDQDADDRRQREQIAANQQRDQGVALARWRSAMPKGGS